MLACLLALLALLGVCAIRARRVLVLKGRGSVESNYPQRKERRKEKTKEKLHVSTTGIYCTSRPENGGDMQQQTLLCGVIGGPTEKRYGHGPGTNAADCFCVQQFGRPPVAEAPRPAYSTIGMDWWKKKRPHGRGGFQVQYLGGRWALCCNASHVSWEMYIS